MSLFWGEQVQAEIDDLSFEEWWAELRDAVRAWLLRRRCPPHMVDDIVQETGLRLFKMWDEIDAMRSPRGLAFTIATNLLWDERNRRSAREVIGDVPEQSCEDVERAGIARLELARVRRAMSRLNPQQREILLAEIGDAPESVAGKDAAKMMRMRARKRLHALLDTAPAGIFALVGMPKRWWKAFRAAQRSTLLQTPMVALVATCTTIALVGIPPSQVLEAPAPDPSTIRVTTARTAAAIAVKAVPSARRDATSSQPKLSAKSGTGSDGIDAASEDVSVDVPEGTPVHGGADVSVTPGEGFVFKPPTCDADPNGTTVHVQCETQVGDKRVVADTVLGVKP